MFSQQVHWMYASLYLSLHPRAYWFCTELFRCLGTHKRKHTLRDHSISSFSEPLKGWIQGVYPTLWEKPPSGSGRSPTEAYGCPYNPKMTRQTPGFLRLSPQTEGDIFIDWPSMPPPRPGFTKYFPFHCGHFICDQVQEDLHWCYIVVAVNYIWHWGPRVWVIWLDNRKNGIHFLWSEVLWMIGPPFSISVTHHTYL